MPLPRRALGAALLVLALLCPAAAARAASSGVRLDPSFGKGGIETVGTVEEGQLHAALTPSGGVIVADGDDVTALRPDGSYDRSFGEDGQLSLPTPERDHFRLAGVAVDSRGRIVVAGTLRSHAAEPDPFAFDDLEHPEVAKVMRYLPDGTPDPSFADHGVLETTLGLAPPEGPDGTPFLPAPSVRVEGMAVDSADRVILAGGATAGTDYACRPAIRATSAIDAAFVARLTASGAPDPTFGAGRGVFGGASPTENPLGLEVATRPLVEPDGQVVYASAPGICPADEGMAGLGWLGPTGATTTSANASRPEGRFGAADALGPRGSVLVLWTPTEGYVDEDGTATILSKFESDGRPDPRFGDHGRSDFYLPDAEIESIVPLGHGYLAGGVATDAVPPGGGRREVGLALVRIGADGKPDPRFGGKGKVFATRIEKSEVQEPTQLLLDREGRAILVAAGKSKRAGGHFFVVARFLLR